MEMRHCLRFMLTIIALSLLFETASAGGIFSENPDSVKTDLVPRLHGVIRPRWEMDTRSGESRFQVRNARVVLSGMLAPSIDYFSQVDLSDMGKFLVLDLWGRLALTDRLKFQAGQFRVPFGTDCFRGPGNYIFANRSFLGGTLNNVRAVGVQLSFNGKISDSNALTIDVGVFNPTAISDHNVWIRKPAFAGKATMRLANVSISAGAETLIPQTVRVNALSATGSWSSGRWLVEGEFLYKHYTNHAFGPVRAYNIYADYRIPVKLGLFRQASVQARYDGMTAYSTGVKNDAGVLVANYPERQRVTVGGMLFYSHKSVGCDLRLNYEKYFYKSGAVIPVGADDKVTAEIVFIF